MMEARTNTGVTYTLNFYPYLVGISFALAMFKLAGVFHISWWAVVFPLFIPWAFLLFIFALFAFCAVIYFAALLIGWFLYRLTRRA